MTDTYERDNDAQRRQQPAHCDEMLHEREPRAEHNTTPQPWQGFPVLAPSLLGESHLATRANMPTRASLLHGLQGTHGNHAVQRAVHLYLQRSAASSPPHGTLEAEDDELGRRIERSAGQGHRLDPATRGVLETGLDADLSDISIHTGEESDRLARSMQAVAFTSGQDIYFRSGAYSPDSCEGLRLLAHEATHAVQQSQGPVAGTQAEGGVSISDPSDSFEQEAERVSRQVTGLVSPAKPSALPLPGVAGAKSSAAKPVQRYYIGYIPGSENVHQIMTAEAQKRAGMLDPNANFADPAAKEFALGASWNDDPLLRVMNQDDMTRNTWGAVATGHDILSAKGEAAEGKEFGPGDSMLSRTHFGDLQFLHGMAAKDNEKPEESMKKMMMWAEFSGKIASGELGGNMKLGELGKGKDPSGKEDDAELREISKLFPDMKDKNINDLFGIKDGKGDVRQRAMGSLVHLVQDTYSSGHVQRDDQGNITQFHSYSSQNDTKHGKKDEFPAGFPKDFDPTKIPEGADSKNMETAMQQSTELLKMMNKGAKWEDMEKYLKKDVFTMAENPLPGGPGEEFKKGDESWGERLKEGAWGGIKKGGLETLHHGQEAVSWVGDKLGKAWDWTKDTAGKAWDWGKEKAGEAWDWTKDTAKQVGHAVSEGYDWTKEKVGEGYDWTKEKAGQAWDWTKDTAGKAWDWTKGAAKTVGEAAEGARDWTKEKAGEAWDWTKEKGGQAWDWTKDTARQVGHAAEGAWDWTKEKGGQALNWAEKKGEQAWDWTKEKGGQALDWAEKKGEQAYDFGKEKVGEAYDWTKEKAGQAWDWTKGAANSVGDAASDAWGWATSLF